ncbi:MAG TPA: hypothetical protein VGL19_18505 [Polyangiaceae bacterium]|jgi:hypothetical protein
MAEVVACLTQGRVVLLQSGLEQEELRSPYADELGARTPSVSAPVTDVSRGRRNDELCYAISSGGLYSVFTQVNGSGRERRLFAANTEIKDLDFSFADEALTCTVVDKNGTSAIGLLRDDGKGMRTVTEGDVLDQEPRWAPGGRAEIVYASAGIGRTKSGARVGVAPFSLHRLSLADSTVEVLVADAKYDYVAPVPVSQSLIYAIRRPHLAATAQSPLRVIVAGLLAPFRKTSSQPTTPAAEANAQELVRITDRRMEVVASGVRAFDVSAAGVIVYSNGAGVFRISPAASLAAELITELAQVEQIVIC